MKRNIESIIPLLPTEVVIIGKKDVEFFNSKPIKESDINSISWIKFGLKDHESVLLNSGASVVVCHLSHSIPDKLLADKLFIKVNDPKLVFIKILDNLFKKELKPEIHPTAFIDENSKIGNNVYIGPNTVVKNCIIGDNCIIYGNCFVFENTIIGNNVIINPGTVIGADGFGYKRNDQGIIEKFPHLGGVIIEDDVEIGSNTSIDKGTLGNTIIKKGVKIDNLVHIAHNVVINEHCMLIANCMIGGSVEIGEKSWIAPSASVINGVKIGKNVTIGMGAVVTKNIPDNQTWTGSPAKELSEFIIINNKLKKL